MTRSLPLIHELTEYASMGDAPHGAQDQGAIEWCGFLNRHELQ